MQLRYLMRAPRGLGMRYMPAGNVLEPDREDQLTVLYFDVDRMRRLGCQLVDPQPESFLRTDPNWQPVADAMATQPADQPPAAGKTTRAKRKPRGEGASKRRQAVG